jgi:ferredoxin-type protein NapH
MSACPPSRRPKRLTCWRRIVQGSVAAFFLLLPLGGVRGFTAVAGTLASLKLGPVDLVEPAGAASAALAGLTLTTALVTGAALLILLAIVLGPVFCSWVCPWSLISEAIDHVRFRGARAVWSRPNDASTRRVRWRVLLGLLACSLVLGLPIASLVSGPRLITTLPLELVHLRTVSAVTGTLLVAMLALEVAGPRRLWCLALCPAGAAIKLLRTRRTLGPVYRADRCADPRVPLCLVACPWGLDPRRMRVSDGCTTCLACVDACGTQALVTRFGPGGLATEVTTEKKAS